MAEFSHLRSELAAQLSQMSPHDIYHGNERLDEDTYYAAMDRAIALVEGKIHNWTDLKPEEN